MPKTRTDRQAERLVADVQRTMQRKFQERSQQEQQAAALRRLSRRMKDTEGNIAHTHALIEEIDQRIPALEHALGELQAKGEEDHFGLREELAQAREKRADLWQLRNDLIRQQHTDKEDFERRLKASR